MTEEAVLTAVVRGLIEDLVCGSRAAGLARAVLDARGRTFASTFLYRARPIAGRDFPKGLVERVDATFEPVAAALRRDGVDRVREQVGRHGPYYLALAGAAVPHERDDRVAWHAFGFLCAPFRDGGGDRALEIACRRTGLTRLQLTGAVAEHVGDDTVDAVATLIDGRARMPEAYNRLFALGGK